MRSGLRGGRTGEGISGRGDGGGGGGDDDDDITDNKRIHNDDNDNNCFESHLKDSNLFQKSLGCRGIILLQNFSIILLQFHLSCGINNQRAIINHTGRAGEGEHLR